MDLFCILYILCVPSVLWLLTRQSLGFIRYFLLIILFIPALAYICLYPFTGTTPDQLIWFLKDIFIVMSIGVAFAACCALQNYYYYASSNTTILTVGISYVATAMLSVLVIYNCLCNCAYVLIANHVTTTFATKALVTSCSSGRAARQPSFYYFSFNAQPLNKQQKSYSLDVALTDSRFCELTANQVMIIQGRSNFFGTLYDVFSTDKMKCQRDSVSAAFHIIQSDGET